MWDKMKVRIKTYDWKKLNYETSGAVAFDVRAMQDYEIKPWEVVLVDTGTVVEIPKWYWLILTARSSTFKNYWLMLVNWVWVIDQDYRGDSDTLKYNYYNITQKTSIIKKGDRIWAAMFVRIDTPEFEVVDKMWNKDRWWFWTTWLK